MEQKQTQFGIGARIALPAAVCAALAGVATRRWPGVCLLRSVPYPVSLIAGGFLLVLGATLLAFAVVSMKRAYNSNRLATRGVFALCRHPVYAAWIVLIVPGIALLARSWPLMIVPLVAYIAFKFAIHEEDDYLRARFGSAYLEYRAKVNELIPL